MCGLYPLHGRWKFWLRVLKRDIKPADLIAASPLTPLKPGGITQKRSTLRSESKTTFHYSTHSKITFLMVLGQCLIIIVNVVFTLREIIICVSLPKKCGAL